jgi:HD-GYP domain-containing protein (c-di-GMP phosphodiesterase class II)
VSVVDAHDAMTHDRPYRNRLSDDAAMNELLRNRGTQFDPELVDLYVGNLADIDAEEDAPDAYTRGLRRLIESAE